MSHDLKGGNGGKGLEIEREKVQEGIANKGSRLPFLLSERLRMSEHPPVSRLARTKRADHRPSYRITQHRSSDAAGHGFSRGRLVGAMVSVASQILDGDCGIGKTFLGKGGDVGSVHGPVGIILINATRLSGSGITLGCCHEVGKPSLV